MASALMLFCCLLLANLAHQLSGLTSHTLRHHSHSADGEGRPELNVRLHEEVVLACDVNDASVVWKHDGRSVQHSSAYRVVANSLRIARIGLQDQGAWLCDDPQSRSAKSAKAVWIVVIEAPRSAIISVDGRRAGAWIALREGAPLNARCILEGGRPSASAYEWWLEGAEGARESLTNNSEGADLLVDKVPRDWHNATLVCAATHPAVEHFIRTSTVLNISYSPSFAISRIPGFGFPLHEGLEVSLKCDVDSNPPALPKWMKDDGDPPVAQSADGFLNFSSINRDHVGWYKCSAEYESNAFASSGLLINVRYDEAYTKQPLRQVEVTLGGGVTLECGSEGATTGGPNCWGRVLANERVESVGSGSQLRLDTVLYQEAGNYRCVAPAKPDPMIAQRKAQLQPDIQLVVTGQPVVYPVQRNVTALAGSQLSLAVEFCANPAASHAFWLTSSIVLMPGQQGGGYIAQNLTEGDSELCRRAALTIGGVYSEHAGEYLFMVRSPRGIAEGAVTLQVVGSAPRRPTAAPTVHRTPPPPPSLEEESAQDEPPRVEAPTETLPAASSGTKLLGGLLSLVLPLLLP